ncbi:hypothetical protein Tcan_16769 [Toxocara canis]|uniref:Uncharacterized protein n=1 Tax=Toxocara canis TaxID=6265 RepID=A0A0B2US86_TOXCA|nr:hypothetical protein Tcan_16769 [Toxocara canis]
MESASAPGPRNAISSSNSDDGFVGSASLTADEYLRPLRTPGAPIRRPFSYETHAPCTTAPSTDASSNASIRSHASTDDLLREQNMVIRYRFFSRLDPGGSRLVGFCSDEVTNCLTRRILCRVEL